MWKRALYANVLLQSLMAANIVAGGNGTKTADINVKNDKNFLSTNGIFNGTNGTQTLNVNLTGTFDGNDTTLYGALLNSNNGSDTTIRGNNKLNINVNSTATGDNGSLFFASGPTANMNFQVDLNLNATGNIGKGAFYIAPYNSTSPNNADASGTIEFFKGLSADLTGANPSSNIFNVEQENGRIFVNMNSNQVETTNIGTSMPLDFVVHDGPAYVLKGDINIQGSNAFIGINLVNQQSYFLGSLKYHSGKLDVGLRNGGKWIVTSGDLTFNNFNILNLYTPPNDDNVNDLSHGANISVLDLVTNKIGENGQKTINTPSTKVTINTLAGSNGLFRMGVNLDAEKGDHIHIEKVDILKSQQGPNHKVQVFQDPANDKEDKNVKLEIIDITKGGDNLAFDSVKTKIGLFDYKPQIVKEKKGEGYSWSIYKFKKKQDDPQDPEDDPEVTPDKVQDELRRWLSLQYRVYRMNTDSINKHIDELIKSQTKHNVWSNYFIGSQSYKNISSDSYKVFQGGYDYGMTLGNIRHFAGGFFDILRDTTTDIAFDGKVSTFGIGGYYQATYFLGSRVSLDFDAKIKYSYNGLTFIGKEGLTGANFIPSYNLFMMGARLGAKVNVDASTFVEPSAESRVSFLNGGEINILDKVVERNFGARQDAAKISTLMLNMAVAKKKSIGPGTYGDVRARVFYANDSNIGGDITLVDVDTRNNITSASVSDNRLGLGFDANAVISDSLRLYASLERTFFSEYNTDYLVRLGFRLSIDGFVGGSRGALLETKTRVVEAPRTFPARPKGKIVFRQNQRPLPKIVR